MRMYFACLCFVAHSLLVAQQVDGGNGHAIILADSGAVFTVGRNNYGQLGNGTLDDSGLPVHVKGLPPIASISRGYDHSVAIDSSGAMWLWGRNNYGQLGTTDPADFTTPQRLEWQTGFIQAEGGHWHTLGLKRDGTVWGWGHNFYGELGGGHREHSQYPVQVYTPDSALSGIVKIASVGYFALALNGAGEVYAWGGNDFGEVGHFDAAVQPFARKVPELSGIVDIACGWHHAVALDQEGRVFLWGTAPSTQHEKATLEHYPGIQQVAGLPAIKSLACGSWHTLALDEYNRVWGWGKNHFGMLGTGDSLSTEVPQILELPENICSIGGGCFQSLAVGSDGRIWTMGDNPSGQQGQGNLTRQLVPSVVQFEPQEVMEDDQSAAEPLPRSRMQKLLILLLAFSLAINGWLMQKFRMRGSDLPLQG